MNENTKDPLTRLIHELTKLPTVGEKTATRMAMSLLKDTEYTQNLSEALLEVKNRVHLCKYCFHFTENEICSICSSHKRNHGSLAVVETPNDLLAIERTQHFRGIYHVLHGTLSPLEGIGPDELKIKDLLKRIQGEDGAEPITEVILALNPSVEGEATSLYLHKLLKNFDLKIARIAHGMPMGGCLEYADRLTIEKAFEYRTGL
jgi:recombination protein RecR